VETVGTEAEGKAKFIAVFGEEWCVVYVAKVLEDTLGTNTYLLIRYMSRKLQTNGKKTSPVITLQMLGFFRIY